MAVFTSWTVLPNDGIEKIADNLWRVSGTMPGGKTQRQMVLARGKDGRVIVHNAIALDDAGMKQIDDWGEVATVFVPNGFHRQDAAIWKQRYPKARIMTPAAATKRVKQVVPVDLVTEDGGTIDETIAIRHLDGVPIESVMEVRSGDDVTLVFTDIVLNLSPRGGLWGFLLGPTGRVSAPRLMRMVGIKNKKAFVTQLGQLAATPGLRRVLVGHGAPILTDPAGALRTVVEQLGGA